MAQFIQQTDIIILVLIAVLLLIFDRIYRINRVNKTFESSKEQCGVNKPACKFGEKCANGYCINNSPPELKPTMLPVFP